MIDSSFRAGSRAWLREGSLVLCHACPAPVLLTWHGQEKPRKEQKEEEEKKAVQAPVTRVLCPAASSRPSSQRQGLRSVSQCWSGI